MPKIGLDYCPYCKHKLDAATEAFGDKDTLPMPGDVSVCIKCGGFLRYTKDMSLRKLEHDEFVHVLEIEEKIKLLRVREEIRNLWIEKQ